MYEMFCGELPHFFTSVSEKQLTPHPETLTFTLATPHVVLLATEQLHFVEVNFTPARADPLLCRRFVCSRNRTGRPPRWRLFKTQKVWMLFYSLGMTHICWCKARDRAALPVPGWRAHRARQATRLETGIWKPRSVRRRSAAQKSNVGTKPAQTSLPLALCAPASPLLLWDKSQKKTSVRLLVIYIPMHMAITHLC